MPWTVPPRGGTIHSAMDGPTQGGPYIVAWTVWGDQLGWSTDRFFGGTLALPHGCRCDLTCDADHVPMYKQLQTYFPACVDLPHTLMASHHKSLSVHAWPLN